MEPEMQVKIEQIRAMLAKRGFGGVLMESQPNLSWLTGGRHFVNVASTNGLGAIWVGADHVELIVNNIEGERLWQEEGGAVACDVLTVYPWYREEKRAALVQERMRRVKAATDQDLSAEFLELRLRLTPEEQARYRVLGRLAGEAVETVACEACSGQSEYELAGLIAKASYERGLEPLVCLVGADERATLRRHPLPTEKKVEHYALLVLSARRFGLVASVSRAVYLGKAPVELIQKQESVNRVLARMLEASHPGVTLGAVFQAGLAGYAEAGFPDEWQAHHQGGLAGYQSREVKATAESGRSVEAGMALAWNPTLQGSKAEETFLLTPEGLEDLTATGNWPMQRVTVGERLFELPWILES